MQEEKNNTSNWLLAIFATMISIIECKILEHSVILASYNNLLDILIALDLEELNVYQIKWPELSIFNMFYILPFIIYFHHEFDLLLNHIF